MVADFLVIGSGIAGLVYAIKVAEANPEKKILVTTKASALETNTRYAQGGVAAVMSSGKDSVADHFYDTMKAGDFLCDGKIVDLVVRTAGERINEIQHWGARFDKDNDGSFLLGLEGGHSRNRILHHKDITGLEIQTTLLRKIRALPNVTILTELFAKDLIIATKVHEKICKGAVFIDVYYGKEIEILAGKTLLATGGAGQVYLHTTNPPIATGDGIAIAARAGAEISNMEFVQFHPTVLYSNHQPPFLISEAVRGAGAILVNSKGKSFVDKYSSSGSLATRDIVSRAIHFEMQCSSDNHVYLDCTKIPMERFKNSFPNIYAKCRELGIDVSENPIPVTPAAHYLCGGITTDAWGATSIGNLYACGECANTGLHGANRLASNSLLEALVFAHQSFLHSHNSLSDAEDDFLPDRAESQQYVPANECKVLENLINLRGLMWTGAGIVKTNYGLNYTMNELRMMKENISGNSIRCLEFKNMILVGQLIVKCSLERKENRGVFFNEDLVE
ncbi:MAG: L-aspartate oxidase [Cytophagaceae bacterium]